MFLINPLFPSDCIVPLPPLYHSDPDIVAGCVTKIPSYSGNPPCIRTKYVFFNKKDEDEEAEADPCSTAAIYSPGLFPQLAISDSDDFTVLLQNHGRLHFWKPGRECWLRMEQPRGYRDVVYSKSSGCFYALHSRYDVDVWEWLPEEAPRMRTRLQLSDPAPRPRLDSEEEAGVDRMCELCGARHLVESTSGDLLLVLMYSGWTGGGRTQFYVYRLNFDDEKWEHVKCLGASASALLLGRSYGFCVSADEYPELKPNCIYYIEDQPHSSHRSVDMEVFDMQDNTIQSYRLTSDHAPQLRAK